MTRRAPIKPAPWTSRVKPIARPGSTIDPALRALVRGRAGHCCELCAQRLGRAFEAHHRKLRSQGGQDSACNLVALCGMCHRRVHGHPTWAVEHGFIVPSTQDPATVPVAVHLSDWHLLRTDGTYQEQS